jgi:PAS domain S-box-containing protein
MINSFKKNSTILEHYRMLSMFSIYGGIAFALWGVVATFLEQINFEIWPIRFGIGAVFFVTGFLIRQHKWSLSFTEWWLAGWGLLAAGYAFFVSFKHGLHPAWVTGTGLIIIAVLNFLTFAPQTIAFSAISLGLAFTSFLAPAGTINTNPWTIVLNFGTAIFLGSFASYLRNNFLQRLTLMESNQEIIWTTLKDGIVLHAPDGRILALNPAAPKILGLSEDQIMGRSNIDPIWQTYHVDGRPCPPEEHPSAVAQRTGKTIYDFPLKLVKVDKSIAWLSITAVPRFEDHSTEPSAVVVSIRDVTAQKSKDDLIQQQQHSLAIAGRLSSLGEMASGIAHEINNPLAVIAGKADLINRMLTKDPLPKENIAACIDIIKRTTMRIARIVTSMKSLSRQNDHDSFSLNDLKTIVLDVLAVSQDRIRNKGIELDIEDIPETRIECHAGQIGQALLNILNNSVDAVERLEDRWIRIGFNVTGKEISISITDSGAGIPIELREKILQPFFTTKEIGKGTGLGLSLVQSIAHKHGGWLQLDEQNKNTSFVLTLPLVQNKSVLKAS